MTLGPRIGWAGSGNFLVFLGGGAAHVGVDTREAVIATGLPNAFSTSDNHWGWYLGGGFEYMLASGFIVGLEYQHLDFSTVLHMSTIASEHRNISLDSDVVRARISIPLNR